MFIRKHPVDEAHALDVTIENLISGVQGLEDGSAEQTAAVQSLKTLMEIRTAEKARKFVVSPDVIATGVAQLLGIGMILGFEKANVLTTKSLGFVPKVR